MGKPGIWKRQAPRANEATGQGRGLVLGAILVFRNCVPGPNAQNYAQSVC